jgi:SAM-dependent methyltransferase
MSRGRGETSPRDVDLGWKEAFLSQAPGANGYRRFGGIVGREELLTSEDRRLFSQSEFVARSKVPYTTSAVEARIRRRHLERLANAFPLDRKQPVLELGCADGLVTHALLELGFEKLVSTDIVHSTVATLDGSLTPELRERVLLVVDDLLRLPFEEASFGAVIAWGVLSVTGHFEHALERSWEWVAPGGYMLLAEPLLESVLVYTLVRGDLDEFRRTLSEGTRAGVWEDRKDRYRVNPSSFYEEHLSRLPGATVSEAGGVNMLPSLILGGLVQDTPVPEAELAQLSDLLGDPGLDDLALWRQAFWLLRKT